MRQRSEPGHDTTPFGRLDEGPLLGIVGYQLAQARIATMEIFFDHVGRPFGLRPVEYTVLALIDTNPDLSATKLARALAVTPPNVKMWIDRLVARQLVERSPNKSDRRAQHLRATAGGSALVRQASAQVLAGEAATLTLLSAAERALLLELLHKVGRCRRRA